MAIAIDTERQIDTRRYATVENDRMGEKQRTFQNSYSNVSLALRLREVLASITDKDNGTILGIGINETDGSIAEKKCRKELKDRQITFSHVDSVSGEFGLQFEDASVDAKIGNIVGDENLPATLREIVRVTKPEGVILLNIHKGPNQNGEFDDSYSLDAQLAAANLYVHAAVIQPSEPRWWSIDASVMPLLLPTLRRELNGTKHEGIIYGGESYNPGY